MKFKKKLLNKSFWINFFVVLFLFVLPYYIFEGRLFIGGDDTRLLYVYPYRYLKEWSFFSWFNVSSLSFYNPSFHFVPFLLLWGVVDTILNSKVILNYFAFSTPLVLGYIYFQLLLKELTKTKDGLILIAGSLFYILSPILMTIPLNSFLLPAWLIGVMPCLLFYYLKFVCSGRKKYIFYSVVFSLIFSFSLYSFPWIFGLMLPVFIGLSISSFLFSRKQVILFIRRSTIFALFIVLAQSFWLVPFISSFLNVSKGNIGANVLTSTVIDTFSPTVLATATGNIIYPLFNLFHRSIVFDFAWQIRSQYESFYDYITPLNSLYIGIIVIAFIVQSRLKDLQLRKKLITLAIIFILSLFFFTVNIGPLKQLFLQFGVIPGFVMFRNFYDKFGIGYVFIYSLLISFTLLIVVKRYQSYRSLILICFTGLVVLNAVPIKGIVNNVQWKTRNIYKTITLPKEYIELTRFIESNIPSSTNIFAVPFNEAAYSVIVEENGRNVYIGTSPLKILSGVNDITGSLSFSTPTASHVSDLIVSGRTDQLNNFFREYNINYILVTRNIPDQLKRTDVWNSVKVRAQDENFVKKIAGKEVFRNKNYALYESKHVSQIMSIKNGDNIKVKKINSTKYNIYVSNLGKTEELIFRDTFHPGWKLYIEKYAEFKCNNIYQRFRFLCKEEFSFTNLSDISYFFKTTNLSTNNPHDDFGQKWVLSKDSIKKKYDSEYYKLNKDGSLDLVLTLYFLPQSYFLAGVSISTISIIVLAGLIFYETKKNKKK